MRWQRHITKNSPAKHRNDAAGNEGNLGGIFGTIKNYENPNKEMSAQAEYLSIIYVIFYECDIDYLLGKIDVPRHETADIMSVTGLTDDAVYFLNTLKDCNDPIWRDGLKSGQYAAIRK